MIVVKYEPYKNDITTVAYPVPKVKYKFNKILSRSLQKGGGVAYF